MKRTTTVRGIRTAILLLCMLAILPRTVWRSEAAGETVVSYGLAVLAAETDMALSGPVGNEIAFSEDLFARALNLSEVRYVTVRSLPEVSAGELLLGSTRIAAGQSITSANLPYVTFRPATDDALQASFTFTVNGGTTPMVCNLYLLSGVNYTPTVSLASGVTLNQETYRGMPTYGRLSGYDPDGDALSYEIVSYPRNGSVLLTDRALGSYVYTPRSGYTGNDSFSYVVRDRYGNYSASATVRLRVSTPGTAVTYADMQDSPYHRAAIAVTEAGIMSGTQVGDHYCFYPEERISRLELLVMAMHAAGMTDLPEVDATVFADDAEIPAHMKGYVHAAYRLGYVSGRLVKGELCFLPNESITRAEAAVILSELLPLEKVTVTPTFADQSEIPTWASEAIYSLHAIGVMNPPDGCIEPSEPLTREETAAMLAAMLTYVRER